MLREYQSKEELQQLLNETESFPYFLNIHYDILTSIQERFPENVSRYFTYQNTDGKLLVILYRRYQMAPYRPMLAFCYDINVTFEKEVLWDIFDEISCITHSLHHHVPVTCVFGYLASVYKEWYIDRFNPKQLNSNPCLLFFMTKEQQALLVEECKNGISLPEGYFFDKTNFKEDIDVIIDTWKFGTKTQFRQMPYSLIRHKSSPINVVGFEFLDARGCLNHQYVLPEHRRKGLGTAIEMDICHKLIKENKIPFKFIECSNPEVIALAEKSKFWTFWADNEGPLIQNWMKEKESAS